MLAFLCNVVAACWSSDLVKSPVTLHTSTPALVWVPYKLVLLRSYLGCAGRPGESVAGQGDVASPGPDGVPAPPGWHSRSPSAYEQPAGL